MTVKMYPRRNWPILVSIVLLFIKRLTIKNIHFFKIYFFYIYVLNWYWQLRIGSTKLMLSIAFQTNILTIKSQTGNILGVSRIWMRWAVGNVFRCSTLTGKFIVNFGEDFLNKNITKFYKQYIVHLSYACN